MANEILVVIGHRMGKGEAVARGIEKAGGKAIVIPGMAADMKLGDVMNENNATFGISFCGSGGAGAITAANKYGWKVKSEIRSIEGACQALREGCKVVGLGFMDVEDLGYQLVQTYKQLHGE
ncbi:SFCGS family glycine-rich protein [Anaerorhabdus sp.]|uniref:SFCGS family glycine-rich protein n=1 Tax=Anaerorhabdus sp. TaxID=1872524 RepID=UPI002FC8EAC4